MPMYSYRAANSVGRTTRGNMSASDEAELYQRLAAMELELIDAKMVRDGQLQRFLARRVRSRDLIEFCIFMKELLSAGVSIVDALNDIRDSTGSAKLKEVLHDIIRNLNEGKTFSECLSEHPRIFSRVFVGVIAAGEKTGSLNQSFDHLIDHLKWSEELSTKVKSAARYPIFVVITMISMLFSMMTYMVPQLSKFLLSMNIKLPFSTILLIQVSSFISNFWPEMLIAVIIFGVLFVTAYRSSQRWAFVVDYYAYRVPIVGTTMRKVALSRFAHFFAMMYKSGIGILQCLDSAQGVVANRAMASSLGVAGRLIEQGQSLTNALRTTGEFPDLVIRMVRVGEETGNLDATLENITYFYDREVNNAVEQMVGSIQPALTLVVGSIMAWVIMSILGPIYSSFGQLPS